MSMKTAVSLPDDVFTSADHLARKLGISRSRLFATAVAEFVARNKTSRVTERLNAVYSVENGRPDEWGRAAANLTLRKSKW
jgi:predicted transcriptional regulator